MKSHLQITVEELRAKFPSSRAFCGCYEGDLDDEFPEGMKLLESFLTERYKDLEEKIGKILWDWPREIVTTMDEAKKSEYREYLKAQVLTLLRGETKACCEDCTYPFAKEQNISTDSAACQFCPCHVEENNT